MQIRFCFLVLAVICLTVTSAQSGPKNIQPNNRPNRGALPAPQFNGYNYPVPPNGLRLPQNNHQPQPAPIHNAGFATQPTISHTAAANVNSEFGGQFGGPAPTLKPAHKESTHSAKSHSTGSVQTIRVIHEDRSHGHGNGNVKTVRIIHERNGHRDASSHDNVQTVKIIREGGNSYSTNLGGYNEPSTKTIRIVQSDHLSSETLGRSAGGYKTVRIIQEESPAAHHHGFGETRSVKILEAPAATTYASGDEQIQTFQTIQEINPEITHQEPAVEGLNLVADGGISGYSSSPSAAGKVVTLRVVDNGGASSRYENAYASGGDYKAVKILQEPNPVQYTQQHLETLNLVEAQPAPQAHEYKTVKLLQDSQYGGGSHYTSLGGVDGILKVLQTAGVTTGYGGHGGHGEVKYLRVLKK